MEIIIDTNKIISATLTSGKIRKIVVFAPFKFIAPKYLVKEVAKHRHKLCERFEIPLEHFDYIFDKLISPRIELIDESFYGDRMTEAFELAKCFDEKDAPFIALALKFDAPIWTNDKKMIKYSLNSGKYLALDTQAVEDLLKEENIDEVVEKLRRRYL